MISYERSNITFENIYINGHEAVTGNMTVFAHLSPGSEAPRAALWTPCVPSGIFFPPWFP